MGRPGPSGQDREKAREHAAIPRTPKSARTLDPIVTDRRKVQSRSSTLALTVVAGRPALQPMISVSTNITDEGIKLRPELR